MRRRRAIAYPVVLAALVAISAATAFRTAAPFETRSLDGSRNNTRHPDWGRSNITYLRVAQPSYADRAGQPLSGPSPRSISNRIFNDTSQNLFSENGVTQWGFVWGQFLDHTFGLRQESGGESSPLPFDAADPLEDFRNDFGAIQFARTPAAPGTGTARTPREQLNTVPSYIDAFAVYGGDRSRLEWLLEGPVDGRQENSGPKLMLDGGYLPRRDARGAAGSAPTMAADGRLASRPDRAMVAGDVRANENIALTATHTLFAREHNRIVSQLPARLDAETKFEIARRVVGAEQQFITYTEFLPALGVRLSPYRGYDERVDAGIGNEFAVVGYRAHSMIHGELESTGERADYTTRQLDAIRTQGVEIEEGGGELEFVVPLNVAFFNPDLLQLLGLDAVLAGIGAESQYRNDEQIDNQLRSVLFQVPVSGNPECLDGPELPECFRGVADIAAIDIARGRDHGMPRYTDLRRAFGLEPIRSFTDITGERTDRFPSDPEIDAANPLDDPDILDVVQLLDRNGNSIALGSEAADESAVVGVRRTTVAARLRAIYRDVDRVDAFVGMAAERHVRGTEFGPLQLAMWKRQFEALRDGDRFFYADDPVLRAIERNYGITYRHRLGELIELNTEADVAADVFHVAG